MKTLAEKENEIRSIYILSIRDNELKESLKAQNKEIEERIQALHNKIKLSMENMEFVKTLHISTEQIKAACEQIPNNIECVPPNTFLFEIYNFKFYTPLDNTSKKPFLMVTKNDVDYFVEISNSLSGNATRIKNFLSKIGTFTQNMQNQCEKLKEKIVTNQEIIAKQNDYQTKIRTLEKEREEIMIQIKIDNSDDEYDY